MEENNKEEIIFNKQAKNYFIGLRIVVISFILYIGYNYMTNDNFNDKTLKYILGVLFITLIVYSLVFFIICGIINNSKRKREKENELNHIEFIKMLDKEKHKKKSTEFDDETYEKVSLIVNKIIDQKYSEKINHLITNGGILDSRYKKIEETIGYMRDEIDNITQKYRQDKRDLLEVTGTIDKMVKDREYDTYASMDMSSRLHRKVESALEDFEKLSIHDANAEYNKIIEGTIFINEKANRLLEKAEHYDKETKRRRSEQILDGNDSLVNTSDKLISKSDLMDMLNINERSFKHYLHTKQITPLGVIGSHEYKFSVDQIKNLIGRRLNVKNRNNKQEIDLSNSSEPEEILLSKNEVAELLGVSNYTIQQLTNLELLNTRKKGNGKSNYFDKKEVDSLNLKVNTKPLSKIIKERKNEIKVGKI